jgi:hypothetical protein
MKNILNAFIPKSIGIDGYKELTSAHKKTVLEVSSILVILSLYKSGKRDLEDKQTDSN